MATVTGLTAERMLQIEAASVVDGDVIGDNLILTKHDGTTINAGNVRGPAGPQGPIGSDLVVVSAKPIGEVGMVGHIRAGRQLTAADFQDMGLNRPLGLWNLSDLTDASGNARSLTERRGGASSAVPIVGFPGINGLANTAAQFPCLVGGAQVIDRCLFIPDDASGTLPGANFRIRTGSWGGWVRTTKRATGQVIVGKWSVSAGQQAWLISIANNGAYLTVSTNGTDQNAISGLTDVCDDRWHFVVGTFDGLTLRMFVDGMVEATMNLSGTIFTGNAPVNIGGYGGDAGVSPIQPHQGRLDEVFVTADVLTDDQIRMLYCAKIPHTLGVVPSRISLNVRRRRRGASLTPADFPTQPLRLYNFSAGSFGDEGSNNTPVTITGVNAILPVAGVDGSGGNAYLFGAAAHNGLPSTDAGLPAGVTPRSCGAWMKCSVPGGYPTVLAWGGGSTVSYIAFNNDGTVKAISAGGSGMNGPFLADGQWHFAVYVEDNNAADGHKLKLYVDGKLVNSSTSTPGSITLGGANCFRIGAYTAGTYPMVGNIDTAFVCGYALTFEQILALYNKSVQALMPSPKNVGDHVEGMTATDILATFDTLDPHYQVDLGAAA